MADMSSERSCRACGGSHLKEVLNLGEHPLANELRDQAEAPQDRFRLNLVFCEDCALVQIDETVAPERLFTDYVYRSSFSDEMLRWVKELTDELIESRGLNASSLVIEAASNDGYLLQNYLARGIPVLGIEPAANIAEIALREKGVRTEVAFFDDALGASLAERGLHCDVFHAHNVFAHVPDPNPFLRGIANVLKPDGIAVIEAPYVRDLVEKLEFDTIYHEHFSYFGIKSLSRLAERNGLVLIDVRHAPIHGGSIRYTLARAGARPTTSVERMLTEEDAAGLDRFAYYEAFGERVRALCASLAKELAAQQAAGHSIAAYGASAKGSTLLNTIGIDARTIAFTIDRSPLKQGRYMPGVGIPILPPEALAERQPDVVLVLTWNFLDEIVEQQKPYLQAGGRFLVPIPKPRWVDAHGTRSI
jgi:SAM-dependent methyltransferase